MTKTIAIAGKGGTGKTTISALLVKLLSDKGLVLAIDGDPSENLSQVLGLSLEKTVGSNREALSEMITKGNFSPEVSKQEYLDGKIMEALVEWKGFDLIAMGRPEGPGCYCAANHMLRASVDRLGERYDYVIIDCEAGMEHISRQTTRDVDILLIMTDPTLRGITTAARMKELMREMRTSVGEVGLIMNRLAGTISQKLQESLDNTGLKVIVTIPQDHYLSSLEIEGEPVTNLPPESPIVQKVNSIAEKIASGEHLA